MKVKAQVELRQIATSGTHSRHTNKDVGVERIGGLPETKKGGKRTLCKQPYFNSPSSSIIASNSVSSLIEESEGEARGES